MESVETSTDALMLRMPGRFVALGVGVLVVLLGGLVVVAFIMWRADVSAAWTATVGRYRYLHLALRDPDRDGAREGTQAYAADRAATLDVTRHMVEAVDLR